MLWRIPQCLAIQEDLDGGSAEGCTRKGRCLDLNLGETHGLIRKRMRARAAGERGKQEWEERANHEALRRGGGVQLGVKTGEECDSRGALIRTGAVVSSEFQGSLRRP